jgi:hypothetical protein
MDRLLGQPVALDPEVPAPLSKLTRRVSGVAVLCSDRPLPTATRRAKFLLRCVFSSAAESRKSQSFLMVINLALSHAGEFGNGGRAIQQVVGDGLTVIFDEGLAEENASDLLLRTDQHAPLGFSHGNTSG